jgi:hypothetical protein
MKIGILGGYDGFTLCEVYDKLEALIPSSKHLLIVNGIWDIGRCANIFAQKRAMLVLVYNRNRRMANSESLYNKKIVNVAELLIIFDRKNKYGAVARYAKELDKKVIEIK